MLYYILLAPWALGSATDSPGRKSSFRCRRKTARSITP